MNLPEMDYVLTQHARDAMEKRQIAIAWVEQTLKQPERTEPDSMDKELEHRFSTIAEFDGRVLRVIVNRTTIPQRVVTAFFDRKRTPK